MNKNIASLLEKKMDRKDFLKYMAAAGFVVSGMSGITKALLHQDASAKSAPVSHRGYNSGSYGG